MRTAALGAGSLLLVAVAAVLFLGEPEEPPPGRPSAASVDTGDGGTDPGTGTGTLRLPDAADVEQDEADRRTEAGRAGAAGDDPPSADEEDDRQEARSEALPRALLDLDGVVVGIDPAGSAGNGFGTPARKPRTRLGTTAPCDVPDESVDHAAALQLGVRLGRLLERAGATVIMTRIDDVGGGPCFDQRATQLEGADVVLVLAPRSAALPTAVSVGASARRASPGVRAESARLAKLVEAGLRGSARTTPPPTALRVARNLPVTSLLAIPTAVVDAGASDAVPADAATARTIALGLARWSSTVTPPARGAGALRPAT